MVEHKIIILKGVSRTDNIHGIRNSDWFIVLGGDGHQPATGFRNPNIIYAQCKQRGNLNRHDRKKERIQILNRPEYGENRKI